MLFDNIIQKGVWVGDLEQCECIRAHAANADFAGWDSVDVYLEFIESAHNEDDTTDARGPIDPDAKAFYVARFREAWERMLAPAVTEAKRDARDFVDEHERAFESDEEPDAEWAEDMFNDADALEFLTDHTAAVRTQAFELYKKTLAEETAEIRKRR